MDFSFTVTLAPGQPSQVIYKGIRARVLVQNNGPGTVKDLDYDDEKTTVSAGSATLIEASRVAAFGEGECKLEVRIECGEPISHK